MRTLNSKTDPGELNIPGLPGIPGLPDSLDSEPIPERTAADLLEHCRDLYGVVMRYDGKLTPVEVGFIQRVWDEMRRLRITDVPPCPMSSEMVDGMDQRRALDRAIRFLESQSGKKNRRRRKSPSGIKPLTEIQLKTVHVVSVCDGNLSKAARELGRDRKTVEENYRAAMKKLGRAAVSHTKSQLPVGRRGEDLVSDQDDARG
jgi:hypothetical protein